MKQQPELCVKISLHTATAREKLILEMLKVSTPQEVFDRGGNDWEIITDSNRAALILKSLNSLILFNVERS